MVDWVDGALEREWNGSIPDTALRFREVGGMPSPRRRQSAMATCDKALAAEEAHWTVGWLVVDSCW